ncbi:D-alanyl-D-alanine carboxypeptidase/D-alanyl-D-alanine-endopeptidase [Ilumatobacter sp.]|uniref:D-alanyl-D-alanine carboxypeptidase/D-alanyl-D-alanine-endopeptidase n=1 Tax=Ilumatobacter sp. TaxID=1967498 RepID=UPI003B52B38C
MGALAARSPRPKRLGVGPVLVLALVAAVPAIGLRSLSAWADDRAPGDVAPVPIPVVDPPPPPDPLVEPVASLRRLPGAISRDLNVERFTEQAVGFLSSLNDRSCASISVDGVPIGGRGADAAVLPASTQKLVVAAVALEVLGAERTLRTTALAAAAPSGGALAGDLVLVGGGDPLLTSAWYPVSDIETRPVTDATSFDDLADSVVAAGVERIEGSVLGDGARYDDEYFAPGWGTGVAGLEAGPYDALMANDSRVLGEATKADDPVVGAAREFTRLLRERGVEVVGEPGSVVGAELPAVEIASIDSAPLTDVVAEMLTNSDNNTAEMLVKEIAVATDPEAAATSSRTVGLAAMSEQLDRWGIDTTEVVLADGSGLALDGRLTCDALLELLVRADVDGPIGVGLPVAGETGTLSDVFGDGPVAGRLRAKTGTLNNPPFNQDPPAVKALAGYLPVEGGGAIEFALVLNGPTISDQSEYRPVWDAFVELLAGYPSGPTPAELGPR